MKARKRIDRPTQWEPDTRPLLRYVVARVWERSYKQVCVMSAPDRATALRKATLAFARFPVEVFWIEDWEMMLLEQREAERAKSRPKKKTKAGKLLDEPKPLTEAERIAARKKYQQMKADYLAGLPVKCSKELKAQFEAFRPRKHIPIAVVSDLETSHRTKPIGEHKWRPPQAGFSVTEVCKILEHEHDNDHETA